MYSGDKSISIFFPFHNLFFGKLIFFKELLKRNHLTDFQLT